MLRRSVSSFSNFAQKRFASCLVVAEHNNQELGESTYSAITAASQLGNTTVLVAGKNCSGVADRVSTLKGVNKVLVADDPNLEFQMPENMAPFVSTLASDYSHIVFGSSSFGKNVCPRAAVLSDCEPISEVTAIISENSFERPMYAGNAMTVVESSDSKKFMTVRTTSFEPAEEGGSASVESVSPNAEVGSAVHMAYEISTGSGPSLTSATNVVSGGRGMANGENFEMLYEMSKKIPDCAVGASRAAVDAGYVGNELQVGQTGKVVAPQLYIAVGISGAIQHLAGMKDSKVIVAINKDEEAPIFQVADYGIVGDLFDIVPEMNTKLEGAIKKDS